MQAFQDKVAVITGAASGIGRSIAERSAGEGMKVVLSGINLENLLPLEEDLKARGSTVISVRADVSRREDIQDLADVVYETFGAVHLLVNNAGVGAGTTIWDSTWGDWEWVIGVNLWGVIHGLKIFLPRMLAQQGEGHIVNVASVAGLLPHHFSAPYMVTKHAVVALSEQLYYTLAQNDSRLKVSVLCPGWVKTRIMEGGRNRPPQFLNETPDQSPTPEVMAAFQRMVAAVEAGMPPEAVADQVFAAIRQEKFWILTHPEYLPTTDAVHQSCMNGTNPPLD